MLKRNPYPPTSARQALLHRTTSPDYPYFSSFFLVFLTSFSFSPFPSNALCCSFSPSFYKSWSNGRGIKTNACTHPIKSHQIVSQWFPFHWTLRQLFQVWITASVPTGERRIQCRFARLTQPFISREHSNLPLFLKHSTVKSIPIWKHAFSHKPTSS